MWEGDHRICPLFRGRSCGKGIIGYVLLSEVDHVGRGIIGYVLLSEVDHVGREIIGCSLVRGSTLSVYVHS